MPFLDRPGAALYYNVTGQGPPIVFDLGLGGTHASWWQQIPEFAPHRTHSVYFERAGTFNRLVKSFLDS